MIHIKRFIFLLLISYSSHTFACFLPAGFPLDQLHYAESVFIGEIESYEEVYGAYASYKINIVKTLYGQHYGKTTVVLLVNRFLANIHGYELNKKYILGTTVQPENLESLPFKHMRIVSESVLGANTKEYLEWIKEQKWVMRKNCSDPMFVPYLEETEQKILEALKKPIKARINDGE